MSDATATDTAAASPKRRGRPPKAPEQRDDGNRRLELIRAAAKLFRRKGFDATSTRDIAAAVHMHSGSPFYHFESKAALLFAVMEQGMHDALARQQTVIDTPSATARAQLERLIRNHFHTLHGPGNDFIPVMLYEWRSLSTPQRTQMRRLTRAYEAHWLPTLEALAASGELRAPVRLARLLIFGALNWTVQWFSRRQSASMDDIVDAALNLFVAPPPR